MSVATVSQLAHAHEETTTEDVEVIDVTGKRSDSYGLMPTEDSGSAFGLRKSLYETPRALTEISDGALAVINGAEFAAQNGLEAYGEGEFTASVGFTWVDSTYTDVLQTIKLPSYSVWNGSVGYSYGAVSFLLKGNNLLDEEYYTSADLFDSVVVKPSEGRTINLSVTYKF